jgi:two-component system sensor histidine kinase HydH
VGGHVLVVEPEHPGPGPLARVVSAAGHEVRHTPDSARALDLARSWVQVAVLELPNDRGFGVDLTEGLRRESLNMEVVLVVPDAASAEGAERHNPEVWATVARPFHGSQLMTVVDRALQQVRTQQEKNELTRRAQVAEKLAAVGRLTAGLSHEIRNPLNGASLQLAVLERRVRRLEPLLQAPLMEPLSLVREEITRLEHILQDFLQFARPVQLSMVPLALGPVLDRVASFLSSDAERRGVTLRSEASPGLMVFGDVEQLRQVFLNLTLNGLDAAPPSGEVRLTAVPSTARAGWVEVLVDDSGAGISQEAAERIFEPFFTTKVQGSGLGLPITAAIVHQHGGTIGVTRSPLGGARFKVELHAASLAR